MRKRILVYHIVGAVFATIFGSLLHFIYEISGYCKPVAIIGAVNESTWEHLKIAFWPVLIFLLIEYFVYGKNIKNFYFAKTKQLCVTPILIIVLFYGYTAFIKHNLFLDIFIFILAIVVGYIVSYKILLWKKDFSKHNFLTISLAIILILAFSLLSYFPLKNFLFLDPVTGLYGIIK